tara:strand:+ start:99 stop:263 length:165 start_codon:yes stop_codon:yes gene_type:complete
MKSEAMDLTPTPRATALICIYILKNSKSDSDREWAEEQILKMIITEWPEGENNE